MTDRRLQAARQEAQTTNTLEAWQNLEAHLVRSGESGTETFEPIFEILENTPHADMSDDEWVLLDQYRSAREIGHGSIVRYSNKRARAKFKNGEKVPVGTVGTVFWFGLDNYSGAEKWGVKLMIDDDEHVFFSVATNFDDHALNAWDMVATARRCRDRAVELAPEGKMGARSATSRIIGLAATLHGNAGVITWARWQGCNIRVGVRDEAGNMTWGSILDLPVPKAKPDTYFANYVHEQSERRRLSRRPR